RLDAGEEREEAEGRCARRRRRDAGADPRPARRTRAAQAIAGFGRGGVDCALPMRRESDPAAQSVGRSPPRSDGADKVTGRAKYLDDLTWEGELRGRTIRSKQAHAKITKLAQDPSFD